MKIKGTIQAIFSVLLCFLILSTDVIGNIKVSAHLSASWSALSPFQLERISRKVADVETLIKETELVILGSPTGRTEEYPTWQKVANGQLKIFIQPFKVEQVIYGDKISSFNLVRPGVDPLPPAEDPINRIYPGPLAENEDYVLFLKQLTNDDYFVIGVWQGVYPLDPDGKTVALLEEGFTAFHHLSVDELRRKVLKMKESLE